MKLIITILMFLSLVVPSLAGSIPAHPLPIGLWRSDKGEMEYTITNCGHSEYCVKLSWLRRDQRTPSNLPLLGNIVLNHAKSVGKSKWGGQFAYGGKSYKGTFTLASYDRIDLQVCMGFLCKSFKFVRVG